MGFKNLHIDQSKIEQAIEDFNLDEKPKVSKKGNGFHYFIKKDGEEALVVIYFNKDGSTTINASQGKKPILSKKFAEHLKSECLINELRDGTISVPGIEKDDVSLLLEYLVEGYDIKIIHEEKIADAKRYKLKSPYKDEVTITYYDTLTLLIQGRPIYLYHLIKIFLYEIMPFEQVVVTEAKDYNIDIEIDEIRSELEQLLPTAYHFLNEKILKILTPSLTLSKLEIDLEDYSCFAFPALKGIEGYMKQLLKTKGTSDEVRYNGKLGAIFQGGPPNPFELSQWVKDDISCNYTCRALETAYSLYHSKRHPYFHVKTHIDTTPLIWKKETAQNLILEVFETIEKTYSSIPN